MSEQEQAAVKGAVAAERERIRVRLAEHRVYIEFENEDEDFQGWCADCVCGGFCEPCSTPETAWQAWLEHVLGTEHV